MTTPRHFTTSADIRYHHKLDGWLRIPPNGQGRFLNWFEGLWIDLFHAEPFWLRG